VTLEPNTGCFDLIFEATVEIKKKFGNIAVDDINYSPSTSCDSTATTTNTPLPQPSEFFDLKCDFETSFCDWKSDSNWGRSAGFMSTYLNGPLSDHTIQNSDGFYAYLNQVFNAMPTYAFLKSKQIHGQHSDLCFQFWYQFGGLSSSNLTVSLSNGDNSTNLLWSREATELAKTWTLGYVNVDFNNLLGSSIEFAAHLAGGRKSYMALDDVGLIKGRCSIPNDGKLCDFESKSAEDMCGFEQDATADFKWDRMSAMDFELLIGASHSDHTFQTERGHFMIANALNRNIGITKC
jgi:hypothetical protein